MASDKRDFSDFVKFPGSITNQMYEFPTLFYKDSSGKTRQWTVRVRLVKESPKGKKPKHGHDWDMLKENQIPVVKDYLLEKDLPQGTVSQFWVETGVVGGKISRHPPTYPKKTNVSKANERNTFKQSLVDARAKYLKKREEGGRTKQEFNSGDGKPIRLKKNTTYFPMLAKKYNEEKKHVVWPAITQPKLDGVRCLAFLNVNPKKVNRKKISYKNVILATRQRKEFQGFDHIRRILLEPLIVMFNESGHSLYLDGEFYKHGKALQDISGEVRNIEKNSKVTKDSVKYWVFDCFYPTELTTITKDRLDLLEDFFMVFETTSVDWTGSKLPDSIQKSGKEMVCMVPHERVNDEKELMEQYKMWLSKDYEGLMYRNPNSPYLAHPTKTGTFLRSKGLLKLKMRYSDEFELVGFTEGTKGRDKGAIMWICQTKDGKKTFHATPKNTTLKKRYAMFKKITEDGDFDKKYKGRMMTIEYEDLSKDGVPLRAKSVGFRDYE